MSITGTYKSAEYGRQLSAYAERGQQTVQELQQLRNQLPQLKNGINADTDLTPEQKTEALAEVDAVITNLVTQIKDFASTI